jgi:hypothetical protein
MLDNNMLRTKISFNYLETIHPNPDGLNFLIAPELAVKSFFKMTLNSDTLHSTLLLLPAKQDLLHSEHENSKKK